MPAHLVSTKAALGLAMGGEAFKSEANNSDNRVNQLGLPAADWVCGIQLRRRAVGDSQIEVGWQPFDGIPEQIFEDALSRRRPWLNVKVVSLASAGLAQDQQLVWFERYFRDYRADLVVNVFTPSNRSLSRRAGPLKPPCRLTADGGLDLVLDPTSRWMAPPASVPAHRMLRVQEHIARVGLNFHFNGPVVAKY